jgi:hypothetical protein
MSNPTNHLKAIMAFASDEVVRIEVEIEGKENQIEYLSDKLSKLFHELRRFNDEHGRDLHPEVLDAFNASWRNHESSFDVWNAGNNPESINDDDL